MSEKRKVSTANKHPQQLSRRRFIAGAGAALALTVVKPELVRGDQLNSKIRLGLIGCGKRGGWIAGLFKKHGGYEITAAADYFRDRVYTFGNSFGIDKARRYTGLSCYRKLIDAGGVDAVVIESPPYFHPEQAAAAVNAGLHVYLAKPVAVDVPGCNTIAETGRKASAKKLCFLVDFQTRANAFYREAVKRVQYGDIGRIVSGEAAYQTNPLGRPIFTEGTPEARLRNWVHDKTLSGDIITEQNIHAIDVACWILDENPVSAYGTGGRKMPLKVGDCWDHFAVIFHFPDAVPISFSSKQCGTGYDDILCRMYGEKGTIDTHYAGKVNIRGNSPYKGGESSNLYEEGAVRNIADFHDNITKGRFSNTTVAPSVRSNLTTILGRTAAYNRCEVTWEEVIKANKKINIDLKGLKT